MITVCYASSNSYAWIMTTSIVSLLENNKNSDFLIFILDNGIREDEKNKIFELEKKYCVKFNFIDIQQMRNVIGDIKINERWDFATFGRLFEANLLPKEINKVLHIDCDTIIKGDITSLWETEMENAAVAGVLDCLSKEYHYSIGTKKDNPLFNAGILLFNLEYIRKNDIVGRFVDAVRKYKRLMYLDQDILNLCINKEEKIILNPEYNFYSLLAYCSYKEIKKCRNPYNYYSKEIIENAKRNSVIIHFTSSSLDNGRPWCKVNDHPYKNLFMFYLGKSPFNNHELISNEESNKIKNINRLPKFIKFPIARFINSFLKPILIKNK